MDVSKYFSGGSARVYRGRYDIDKEVAIKILFCVELTPDKVISFCNEVTLLNSLQHPNIVKAYGVAIMPPAISLVIFIEYILL
jgi:serine/threonine protein kinase